MVYVYSAPELTLTEAERTAAEVPSNLRPKTRGPYRVISATADTVTIEEGGIHSSISINRTTVSPSSVSPQNVESKDKDSALAPFRSTVTNEYTKVSKPGHDKRTARTRQMMVYRYR